MQQFCSRRLSRQRLVEKSVEAEDVVLDPTETAYLNALLYTVEIAINLVAGDTSLDVIWRLVRLSIEAFPCSRRPKETTGAYIERFLLPAQTYLNLVKADS